MPVKFQSDTTIWSTNLVGSRLHEILRKDVFSDIETGPWPRYNGTTLYYVNVWSRYSCSYNQVRSSHTIDVAEKKNKSFLLICAILMLRNNRKYNFAFCIRKKLRFENVMQFRRIVSYLMIRRIPIFSSESVVLKMNSGINIKWRAVRGIHLTAPLVYSNMTTLDYGDIICSMPCDS